MVVVEEIRRRSRKVIGSVLGALVVAYFTYGTVQGDRGLFAYISLSQELARATLTLEKLRTDHRNLEHRVALLRPETLDLDLLEERARIVLDFVGDRDYLVILPSDVPNIAGRAPATQ